MQNADTNMFTNNQMSRERIQQGMSPSTGYNQFYDNGAANFLSQ